MKKYFIIALFVISLIYSANATQQIRAYLTSATFNTPDKGPYIETYLSVIGNSVRFVKNSNGKFQGQINIAISFSKSDTIKNAEKYTLSSPELNDTSKGCPNFIDVHRFALANGNYTMEISIADKNNETVKPFVSTMPVVINYENDKMTVSEVQLLESYTKSTTPSIITKSGYDLVPYVSNFYPENITKLKFYAEIYNAKKILGDGEKMLVSYSIQSHQAKTTMYNFSSFSKQTANDVNILLAELDVDQLPSGNYDLAVIVKDKENKTQAVQLCFFQRKNRPIQMTFDELKSLDITYTFVSKYKSKDTLSEYIRSLRPISSPTDIQYAENQLKGKDLLLMQQFFYNFWKSRNEFEPETAWQKYLEQVQKVNKEYATYGMKGYDTDRGRIFLQYGPPTIQAKYEHEPSAYPYEIWQYDVLVDKSKIFTNPYNKQSNRKFVFYNPDLVTNQWRLIHSDARGEINNTGWEMLLFNRSGQSSNPDDVTPPEQFGSNVDDNFRNPR